MRTALFVLTVVCIVADTAIVIADLAKAPFVAANSTRVGLRPGHVPYLAALKLAGAAGLAIGLAGVRWLGLAAGIGLVVFFVGAVGAHVRARVWSNIAFPGAYLLLAVASAAHFAAS